MYALHEELGRWIFLTDISAYKYLLEKHFGLSKNNLDSRHRLQAGACEHYAPTEGIPR